MYLKKLSLQNFRSYSQATFIFNNDTTVIVGPNTAGKSNLCEAIFLLATGESFRTEKDLYMIRDGQEVSWIKGLVEDEKDIMTLEVLLATGESVGNRFTKKYRMNSIPRKKIDFGGLLPVVLFSPEELDIIIAGPSYRRNFLDRILVQVDREYRLARSLYDKALRQRNALLHQAREFGKKNIKQFVYWDELLIMNGQILTKKREELLDFINEKSKEIFTFWTKYDKSIISEERLRQYGDAELSAGITLVGPHRDDFSMEMSTKKDIRFFGSRGQQRLVVLQLKMIQIQFMQHTLGKRPLLLLDDIFSELDSGHIDLVLQMLSKQQTIITTTHKEFVSSKKMKNLTMLELEK